MACKTVCRLCDHLVISQSVLYNSGVLIVNLPEGTYVSGEKYCIVIAQAIPDTAIINAPVLATIGTAGTTYPIVKRDCSQLTAASLRTRTRYATRVSTTATGGTFRLLGKVCDAPDNSLPAIGG